MKGTPCVAGCRCRRHRDRRAHGPPATDDFDAVALAAAILRGEPTLHTIDVEPRARITTHPRIEEIQALVGNDYAPRIEPLGQFATHSTYSCEWRSVRHLRDDLRSAGFVLSA